MRQTRLVAQLEVTSFEFSRYLCHQKNKSPWAVMWRCLCDFMFCRFSLTPTCDSQTDGRTTEWIKK